MRTLLFMAMFGGAGFGGYAWYTDMDVKAAYEQAKEKIMSPLTDAQEAVKALEKSSNDHASAAEDVLDD